jgi:hypothetical protein
MMDRARERGVGSVGALRRDRVTPVLVLALAAHLTLFLAVLPGLHTCPSAPPGQDHRSLDPVDGVSRHLSEENAPERTACPACLFLAHAHWLPATHSARPPSPPLALPLTEPTPEFPRARRARGPGLPRGPPSA